MVLDASGKKLATPGGRDIASFDMSLNALQSLEDLNNRKAEGEKGLDASILLAELRLGSVALEEGSKRRKNLKIVKTRKFDKAQWTADMTEIDALLFNLQLSDMLQKAGRDADKQAELAEAFYGFAKDGKFASGDMTYPYWNNVIEVAKDKKDAEVFEQGYKAMYAMYKDNPRAAKFLAEMKKELDAMKQQ